MVKLALASVLLLSISVSSASVSTSSGDSKMSMPTGVSEATMCGGGMCDDSDLPYERKASSQVRDGAKRGARSSPSRILPNTITNNIIELLLALSAWLPVERRRRVLR